ncbi:MAG TPA: PKD domain-containing protein [Candidatus Limnocylindrales bacterium]|nr:PKD domain-containing protein [Candidatus Limnocylindrales bacterium]
MIRNSGRPRPIFGRGAHSTRRSWRGQSLVEFALILPVAFVLLAGALDLGRVFYARISLHNAAREGAMQAAQTPDSYKPGQPCDQATNQIVCRVLLEVEDAWVEIDPSDVGRTCSVGGCPAAPGSTVTVSVVGHFTLATPLLASVFGGQQLTLASSATAQIEYLPSGPTGSTPNAPTAQFVANPPSGGAPHTVQFTDLSSPSITGWLWDFGDGQQSTEQSPLHTYQNPGTYTVSLTVVNLAGQDSEVRSGLITVTGPDPSVPPNPSPSPSPLCDFPPDIIGMSPATASQTLGLAGFVPNGFGDLTTGQKNKVQAQNPDHTQCIAPGSIISYHYRPS